MCELSQPYIFFGTILSINHAFVCTGLLEKKVLSFIKTEYNIFPLHENQE